MPIRMLLKDDRWFGPEDIAGLTEALQGALSKLGLVNRDDPATLTVAKLIIRLAKEGERHPAQLRDHAVEILKSSADMTVVPFRHCDFSKWPTKRLQRELQFHENDKGCHLVFFGRPAKCEVAHTSFRLAPPKSGMATSMLMARLGMVA